MIKLFVSDIDGCLSEPYQPVVLPLLVKLAALVDEGQGIDEHQEIPAFSLCSGRPFPYVECVAQMLGVSQPVLFESGGGMFNPITAKVSWSPYLTDEVRREVDEVASWMVKDCVPGSSMIFDYAKRTQAGVIGPDPDEIAAHVPLVRDFVAQNGLSLHVMPTFLSIDVIPEGITKDTGMAWLARTMDISLSEIGYIGDSIGDIDALKTVGLSFAPENAMDEVKGEVDHITGGHLQGVLEAVRMCIRENQERAASVSIK